MGEAQNGLMLPFNARDGWRQQMERVHASIWKLYILGVMKGLLIQLDEQTLMALNRVASPSKRQRSEFVRQAIRQAIRCADYNAMRVAYLKQPDSIQEVDDWSTSDEFEA